jgi:hypothetical protein
MNETVDNASARFCGLAQVSRSVWAAPGMRTYDNKAQLDGHGVSFLPQLITGQGLLRDRRGTRVRTSNAS